MPLLEDLTLHLDVDAVLRGQGADPGALRSRSPRLVQAAQRALAEGVALLRPAVLYEEFQVQALRHQRLLMSGGGVLEGELIARHLAQAEEVLVIVCTIGEALEKRASQAMEQEPVYGLALDGVGAAAVEALANAACQRLAEQAATRGLKTTIPLSPGMAGWPLLEGQQQLFALLDSRRIGVALTEHGLMLPWKSLSMVLGVGRHVRRTGRPCDSCEMRETCRYRSPDG